MSELRHRVVETNGIRIHVAEQGEGPLVLFCHGFPESWYSWRHQLPAVAAADFHPAAMGIRGYGATSPPAVVDPYTLSDLARAVVGAIIPLWVREVVVIVADLGPRLDG